MSSVTIFTDPKAYADPAACHVVVARHPIETFRQHVWVSPFYEEPIDELARWIGVSQVLFGSDYPHPEGLAEPLSFLDELGGFGPDDQQRIMSDNLKALLAPAQ
jgi:predicted TIM-barrel fold metal-dependent hydrolase